MSNNKDMNTLRQLERRYNEARAALETECARLRRATAKASVGHCYASLRDRRIFLVRSAISDELTCEVLYYHSNICHPGLRYGFTHDFVNSHVEVPRSTYQAAASLVRKSNTAARLLKRNAARNIAALVTLAVKNAAQQTKEKPCQRSR